MRDISSFLKLTCHPCSYECMLDSVLHARARFLKPTGLMVPSQCSIMLSLFDGTYLINDRINFWNDVYGYDMTAMKGEIYDDAMIEVVRGEDVVSDEVSLMVRAPTSPNSGPTADTRLT